MKVGPFAEPEEAELPPLARRDRAGIIGIGAYNFPSGLKIRSHRQSNDEALLGVVDGIMDERTVGREPGAVLAELAFFDQVVWELGDDCLAPGLVEARN